MVVCCQSLSCAQSQDSSWVYRESIFVLAVHFLFIFHSLPLALVCSGEWCSDHQRSLLGARAWLTQCSARCRRRRANRATPQNGKRCCSHPGQSVQNVRPHRLLRFILGFALGFRAACRGSFLVLPLLESGAVVSVSAQLIF